MEKNMVQIIDGILSGAAREGRQVLYEFEVYQMLEAIGIAVPRHLFVASPKALNLTLLEEFGSDLVVKIVSPHIAHKQKLGGVKVVRNWRTAGLEKIMDEMHNQVLAHFLGDPPHIAGFLLVEFVHYEPALGREAMIGFREDGEFGPVLLMSKGGDDAEFFAQHYDAANLLLPPVSLEGARQFVAGLKIAKKYQQLGKSQYIELLADALYKIACLVSQYSSLAAEDTRFRLEALDLNPLVLTADERLVAIDGYAEFSTAPAAPCVKPNLHNLEYFFRPESIAVIGVSADLAKPSMAREIAKLLHRMGHRDLFLVNPKGGSLELGGELYPLHRSFQEIPQPVDLVVYAAPIASAAQFMEELRGKAKAVIVISGLPAGLEYAEFVRQMDLVRPPELRIMGPNCMGVYCAPTGQHPGVNTLFIEEKRLGLSHSARSNTALLTQSGALALTTNDQMKESRLFKAIVSFGNKYDVQITDLLAYFAHDKDTELIALYLEGLARGEGRLFFQLAQEASKPIVAYKSGRTETGAQAAASHTAAMSGNYAVFKAACEQAGIVLAERLEDYYDYVKIFSLLAGKKPRGQQVAVVVNAGFESAVAGDALSRLRPAPLAAETKQKLQKIDVHGLVDLSTALLDVTPMANDQLFTAFVETVLQDPAVDAVVVGIVPHSNALKSTPDTCQDADSMAQLLVQLAHKTDKPLVVSVNGGRYFDDFAALMEAGGLPVYRNIRAAIQALEVFASYHLKR